MRNVTIANNTIYGHSTCLFVRWAGAGNMGLANNAVYCPGATALNAAGLTGSGLPGATIAIRSNYVEGSLSGATVDGSRFVAGGSSASAFASPCAARLLASCWFDPDRQGQRWVRAGARLQRDGSRESLRRRRGRRRTGSPRTPARKSAPGSSRPARVIRCRPWRQRICACCDTRELRKHLCLHFEIAASVSCTWPESVASTLSTLTY
jgi:hypothetical protein